MSELDPDGPISRREFETFAEAVEKGLEKLEATLEKRNPGWANWITMLAMASALLVSTVKSFARVESLESWKESHEEFWNEKNVELSGDITKLKTLAAANREALQEQEMQHRWLADVINLQHQTSERLIRLHHPEIPASDFWPLREIGKASQAAHED